MIILLFGSAQGPTSKPKNAQSQPATQPAGPRIVDFGDGIKINYRERQVEVAGEVILREGPLELFAYCKAPAPKEHESIVLIPAKPQRIFIALGLIGATPGVSTRWFPETQTLRNATGDPIEVLVRYKDGKTEATVHATRWMLDAGNRKPMPATHWIFCGSERSDSGGFAADMEGTLVTVVDFTTSVLSLPQRHSDADAELWLVANSEEIPAIGTPVTLILRPISTEVTIEIDKGGRFRIDGRVYPLGDLRRHMEARLAGWVDRATIAISQPDGPEAAAYARLVTQLTELGVAKDRIQAGNAIDGAQKSRSSRISTSAPAQRRGR